MRRARIRNSRARECRSIGQPWRGGGRKERRRRRGACGWPRARATQRARHGRSPILAEAPGGKVQRVGSARRLPRAGWRPAGGGALRRGALVCRRDGCGPLALGGRRRLRARARGRTHARAVRTPRGPVQQLGRTPTHLLDPVSRRPVLLRRDRVLVAQDSVSPRASAAGNPAEEGASSLEADHVHYARSTRSQTTVSDSMAISLPSASSGAPRQAHGQES